MDWNTFQKLILISLDVVKIDMALSGLLFLTCLESEMFALYNVLMWGLDGWPIVTIYWKNCHLKNAEWNSNCDRLILSL